MSNPPAAHAVRAASRVVLTTWDEEAVVTAARELRAETGGAALAVVFATSDWLPHAAELLEILQVEGHARRVVGCSTAGLIGTGQEDEDVSGFSVLFMDWPDARVETWIVDETFEIPADLGTAGGCLLMGNPLRLNAAMLLEDLNRRHPGLAVFGGLAGGSWEPGELFLLHDGMDATDAAGLLVSIGGLTVRGIVSQGCQPIGEPLTITRVQDDMVYAVGGRPAYEVLVEAVESLPEQDKAEARGNIMAGLAASEYVEEFRRGDFLVRNIIGGDPQTGALRLGAVPRVGQTLQFQIRERDAADEDLRQRSADAADHWGSPSALLLFSCAGRGQGLFGVPNHDAGLLADNLGPVPAAGFFCSGEFGPVAGLNFLHGYTASAMLFYPTAAASGK